MLRYNIRRCVTTWAVVLLGLSLSALLTSPVSARDYFVTPQGAPKIAKADGSKKAPWASLTQAFRSNTLSGGDRLILLDGHHGTFYIGKVDFNPSLEIAAENVGAAHVNSIRIETSSGLTLKGISVWPLSPPEKPRPLVSTSANAKNIIFSELDIRGREDAPKSYMRWSQDDWVTKWRSSGVVLAGPKNQLRLSKLTGVAFAITLQGADGVAYKNQVTGFSGDGIRILGDRSAAIGNRIENCFKVNGNHDDGIQSWSPKNAPAKTRAVSGLMIDSNTIIEWSSKKKHPLRCQLQGIGFFDGFYDRVTIQNNLVVVDHYHGITLYGARRSQVLNNTVVHINTPGRQSPWIRLENHKSGAPAKNNVFANNIAMSFVNKSADTQAMKKASNAITPYPFRVFMDPKGFDYRPKADSGFLNSGSARYAPKYDITGTPRPAGSGPDLGAFER